MKINKKFRLLPLLLCLVFALSACSLPFEIPLDFFGVPDRDASANLAEGGDGQEPLAPGERREYSSKNRRPRRTIAYDEMEYQRPDLENIRSRMEQLTQQLAEAEDFDAAIEIDNETGVIMDEFYGMYTLAMLKKYHDVNDTFYEEEYRVLDEFSVELSNLVNNFNRALVEGPFAEDYRAEIGDYLFESIQSDLLLNSDAVEEHKKERNALNADYNKQLSTLTVQFDGVDYTMDEIYEVENYAQQQTMMQAFYAEHIDSFTQMYARMVELDKLTASELGFDSAADMYYLAYSRDYTPADGLQIANNAKRYIAPMAVDVFSQWFDTGSADMDETMQVMPEALKTIHPELVEAWEFMREYGLYDSGALPGKQSGIGFTTDISGYDAPFIYMYWTDDFSSTSTIMHEFGHYYDFWLHYNESVVFNLDIAETYSQGLELLLQPQYSHFTEYAEEGMLDNMQGFVNVLIFQSLLEEFQQRVYELESFDSVAIGRIYTELLDEYGIGWAASPDENGADHSWISVTHLFDSPFYTISYVTSALAALQIWVEAQEDWDKGVNIYLDLMHADQNRPFTELLESVGLKPVYDPQVMREMAEHFTRLFVPEEKGSKQAA